MSLRRALGAGDGHVTDVGVGRGVRRADLPRDRLDRALVEHDEALAAGDERVAKIARKSVVTRHGDLVVKEHVPLGPWGRVRDRLAPYRHVTGWRNARRLLDLGVDTATPLAWLRREGRVFALYEDLTRLDRLDLTAFRLYAEPETASRNRLRDRVADWLGGLHRRGIYHGDLKGSNVLVREDVDPVSLPLIDTDRVAFFPGPVDDRRRVKNLAQLGASMPVMVTQRERLRFIRRYADVFGSGPDLRHMAKEVEAQLARKTLVVDEPLE